MKIFSNNFQSRRTHDKSIVNIRDLTFLDRNLFNNKKSILKLLLD